MSIPANSNVSAPQTPLEKMQGVLADDMRATNNIIIARMESNVPLIPQIASYLIAAGGKRIRPLLTLASTAMFGGDMIRAHQLAAAVEFIHSATLLHDDVVDGSDQRRGQDAANHIYGNQASVLVGDFLFSRSFELMVEDGSLEVLRILSRASAIIAEGEVMQLSIAGNLETTIDQYLDVIKSKTAALFSAACEVGPVIGGQHVDIQKAMASFGLNLGIGFQMADDVLDYNADRAKLGKTVGDDFREGKMTLPVLMALHRASADEKEFWYRTVFKRDIGPDDLDKAIDYLRKRNALEDGMLMAETYAEKARRALDILPDSVMKSLLLELIDFTIHREY